MEEFTASIPYDWRLYPYDIAGSIAHATMLAKTGIITKNESRRIISGLEEILKEIASGAFEFSIELEDIHMNIENRLIRKIGPVGGKLHTARSRNDQVALDIRMYLRDEIAEIHELLGLLQNVVVDLADRHRDVVMPGYTHLQRAQPVLFGHHLLAYYEMFDRDRGRLADCFRRVNVMPLGAGALAGTVLPIDRTFVAKLLALRDGVREQHRRGLGPGLLHRVHGGLRPDHDAPLALRRGARHLVVVGVRFHHDRRRLHHRLVDHAAEEEPRRGRAHARQDRQGLRQT